MKSSARTAVISMAPCGQVDWHNPHPMQLSATTGISVEPVSISRSVNRV